eukprot:PhM_4_TR3187/c0_g1_i1/m.58967
MDFDNNIPDMTSYLPQPGSQQHTPQPQSDDPFGQQHQHFGQQDSRPPQLAFGQQQGQPLMMGGQGMQPQQGGQYLQQGQPMMQMGQQYFIPQQGQQQGGQQGGQMMQGIPQMQHQMQIPGAQQGFQQQQGQQQGGQGGQQGNLPMVVVPSKSTSFYPEHPRYSGGFIFKVFNDERTHFIQLPSQYVLVTEGSTRYLNCGNAEQMAPRFVLCRHILRDRLCPRGSTCNFIHGVLRAAEGDPAYRRVEVHKNDAMETGMTRYETLPPGMNMVIAYPGEDRNIPIPSQHIYKTRGSELYYRVLPNGLPPKIPQRCTHYHFKKMCHRGAECNFIHIAYDPGMLNNGQQPPQGGQQGQPMPQQGGQQQQNLQAQFHNMQISGGNQQYVAQGSHGIPIPQGQGGQGMMQMSFPGQQGQQMMQGNSLVSGAQPTLSFPMQK